MDNHKNKFIDINMAIDLSVSILMNYDVPEEIAKTVATELVENDVYDYASHGILRLQDYIEAIKKQDIDPLKFPKCEKVSSLSSIVYGQKCFGALLSKTISNLLKEKLQTENIAIVSLIDGNHIGRISSIASSVLSEGAVLLGFSNYNGLGNKTIGYGSDKSLFSTNPLLMAAPTNTQPIVIDMSTSSVSEGKVRTAWLKNEKVPTGWLVDNEWKNINDPSLFYKTPMEAFLTPLGGADLGYKGFGLSLMVEILSGVLSGGSHIASPAKFGGNSALFIAIKPELFGFDKQMFLGEMDKLLKKIKLEHPNIHIPGSKIKQDSIMLSQNLWKWMEKESTNCQDNKYEI